MTVAEKLVKVAENREKLYEAGKKAEYDAFWDSAQNVGKRTSYSYAFSGVGWTDKTFQPKYDILPKPGNGMFQGCYISDLSQILQDCGVKLDTSGSDNNDYMFNGCNVLTHVPVIDMTGQNSSRRVANYTFNTCRKLVSIEKLILPADGSMTFNYTFNQCVALREIRIEGVIGSTVSFSDCPLSRESMESVISALSDTATGMTVSFKKTAKETAFTDDEWSVLTATKTNWTFKLV